MKLSDLRNGAVVETRDGRRYLKVDKTFLDINGSGGFMPISAYNNDLICQDGTGDNIERSADIIKVNNNTLSNHIYSECCNIPLAEVTRNIWTWERPAEILTEDEKEYLRAVIKPFRDKIRSITKLSYKEGKTCFLYFDLRKDKFDLPNFNIKEMYKSMENNKPYSLKELGL